MNCIRNGWNLRQHAWPKSNDVKSYQSWASWTCRASGRWDGSMKSLKASSGNPAYRWRNPVLLRHLLNLKALPTSKALQLYTTLSSTSTTNSFAPIFKRKMNICMMNCDNCLRRFSKMLTNWRWMSSVKNSYIRDKWLCMTCSNNEVWTLIFVKKNCALKLVRT